MDKDTKKEELITSYVMVEGEFENSKVLKLKPVYKVSIEEVDEQLSKLELIKASLPSYSELTIEGVLSFVTTYLLFETYFNYYTYGEKVLLETISNLEGEENKIANELAVFKTQLETLEADIITFDLNEKLSAAERKYLIEKVQRWEIIKASLSEKIQINYDKCEAIKVLISKNREAFFYYFLPTFGVIFAIFTVYYTAYKICKRWFPQAKTKK